MIPYIILSLISTSFNFNMYPSIVLNRRDFLSSTSISLPFFSQKNITKIDEYAHWSIYGLIPPPIEKSITYNELINEIYNKNIIKLQQAPQHDCVVATTTIGHRWACLIKDNDIENINKELKLISNNLQISKGGRFYHLSDHYDKGRALMKFLEITKFSEKNNFKTISLGDSENDISMLEQTDYSCIVKREKVKISLKKNTNIYYSINKAPDGWRESIEFVLKKENENR